MTKRIQELMEQAMEQQAMTRIQELMVQAMELVDPYAVEGDFGPRRLNAEKFAQLIVRECVFAVENHGGMCGSASSKKIKQHFGVEE